MYTTTPTTTHGFSIPASAFAGQSPEPDVKLFLLAHRAFRREFARLAGAAAKAPEYGPRKDAIEEQIATMVRSLHHHHHGEDARIWPLLRERDPAAAVVLDALEAEHQEIDPLIDAVSDKATLLKVRALSLEKLSQHLNRHLDHEEDSALPLIRRHYTAAEWEADGKLHLKKTRADLPTFVCIMFDHMNENEIAGAMAAAPKIMVWMYRTSWRRSYAKRRQLVYGY